MTAMTADHLGRQKGRCSAGRTACGELFRHARTSAASWSLVYLAANVKCPHVHYLQMTLNDMPHAFCIWKLCEDVDHAKADPRCAIQMLSEAQGMHDDVLELKVRAAILGNRITRLDNPITNCKLAQLNARASELLSKYH